MKEPGLGTRDSGQDVHASCPESRVPSPVCRLSDIPPDGLLRVTNDDGTPVCLVRHEGAVYALHDQCTHAEFSLSSGELLADGTVQCLWHGARFDCRSGVVRQGPATDAVPTFAVRVAGDEVFVTAGTRDAGLGTRGSQHDQRIT